MWGLVNLAERAVIDGREAQFCNFIRLPGVSSAAVSCLTGGHGSATFLSEILYLVRMLFKQRVESMEALKPVFPLLVSAILQDDIAVLQHALHALASWTDRSTNTGDVLGTKTWPRIVDLLAHSSSLVHVSCIALMCGTSDCLYCMRLVTSSHCMNAATRSAYCGQCRERR
jgi:hypothetical protein